MARKAQIGKAFASAAARYDENAMPHEQVARRLVDFAARDFPHAAPAILEIGCGTGLLTRAIRKRWPAATITATDIAPEMLRTTQSLNLADAHIVMDGEAPDLGEARFDLILSNLTFQWFEALPDALQRLSNLLRHGGALCFTTMGRDSFADWRDAHAREGLECGMPDHPSLAMMQAMLARWDKSEAHDELASLETTGGRALLHHFHAIGAHVPRADYYRLSTADLRRVIARYDADGGTAAYHILYGKIRHG